MDEARRNKLASTMTRATALAEVIEAIASLGAAPLNVYVERRGPLYRWSIAHQGGPYPLLREVARSLDIPHSSLLIHCTAVDEWTIVAPGTEMGPPDAWMVIASGADRDALKTRVEGELGSKQ